MERINSKDVIHDFRTKMVFVFSGIGSEWKGMGLELLETESVFRKAIEDFDRCLSQHTDLSVVQEMAKQGQASRIEESIIVPFCVVALQIALVNLLRSWGIRPHAVVGHSGGEFVATYAAGIHSLEDILRILWHQNELMRRVQGKGKMAHISLPLEKIQGAIENTEDRISVSAINGHKSIVLTGDHQSLENVIDSFQEKGVFCRVLPTDIPFHSPIVEPYLEEMRRAICDIRPQSPQLPVYSTLRGESSKADDFDAQYWTQHMRNPILFAPAIYSMIEDGYNVFIEVDPHPVLSSYIHECLEAREVEDYLVVDTLRRGEDEKRQLLVTLATLDVSGYPVNWERLRPEDQQIGRSLILSLEKEKEAGGILETVQAALPERRKVLLLDFLLRSIHNLSDQQQLPYDAFRSLFDVNSALTSAGLNSLMAVELRNRIRNQLRIEIPIAGFLDGSNVLDVAALLGNRLREGIALSSVSVAVQAQRRGTYPLSHGQKALWFLYQLAPDSPAYNITYAAVLDPDLDREILKRVFAFLMERHAPLRTTYSIQNGNPIQRVHNQIDLPFEVIDASVWSREELDRWLDDEADRSFDLERGPMLRVKLLEGFSGCPILMVTVHHIAFDFWSQDLLIHELCSLYGEIRSGNEPSFQKMDFQYGDYAAHEEKRLESPEGERLWGYWKEKLSGELPVLNLYTDRPRPPLQTDVGKTLSLNLDDKLTHGLRELSRAEGVTLYMTLLAVFQVLLLRYTSQEDILIGTPTAGRNHAEWEGMIGYFVNPVVIRGDLSGNPTFKELLHKIHRTVLESLENQDYPFPLLVEKLQPKRDLSRSPLFQVFFVWHQPMRSENLQGSGLEGDRLLSDILVAEQRGAAFDLTLLALDAGKQLKVDFTYNANLFDEGTISRMMGHYRTLLEGIVANPEDRVNYLPLLTEPERHQLLVEWNDTYADYPKDKCIHELFEEQAERTPDAVAVVFEDDNLTYRQLNERANQLAHYLQGLGVGPEVFVGICLERSLEMIVGILGILKAGGAYVPLDPAYPRERLAFMLEDTKAPVLLTQEKLQDELPQTHAQVLCLNSSWHIISQETAEKPSIGVSSEDLAYVIYTSGSTGRPKGVLIAHKGWVNLAKAQIQIFDMRPGQRVLQFSSLNFDASVWEMGMSFCSGATLCLAGQDDLLPGPVLAGLLKRQQISHVILVASVLAMIDAEECPHLDVLVVGGEACPPELARRWSHNRRVYNAYGPTETTVCATVFEHHQGYEKLPIGRPIANTHVYVLDHHLQPVPVGVPGELHIGGDSLARDYHNRPELSAEKFIPNPFSGEQGSRLYKTGDLVRYLPDGNIEFIGRIDHQVKIRGFRIELGEIEAVLSEHPAVQETVVTVKEASSGNMWLLAFVTPKPNQIFTPDDLRQHLKQTLPDYMVPSTFVTIDVMPMTPNGKLDRKALEKMEEACLEDESAYVPPQNSIEKGLADLWCSIIGIERVGIHDNFFEIGGNSLAAAQVISRVRDIFNVELPIRKLFGSPTIDEFAKCIEKAPAIGGSVSKEGILPLYPEQTYPEQYWQRRPSLQRLFQVIIRVLFRPLARIEVEGEENMPDSGPLIVAANHINWLDSPLIFSMASDGIYRISNRPAGITAYRWRKVFHWYLVQVGHPIYVYKGEGDTAALNRALAVLRRGGVVQIGPEGTHDHGKLIKGQVGVAYLATQGPAPILPIALHGQDRAISCWKHLRRVPLHVRIGKPIDLPHGDASHKELEAYTAQVMTAIARLLPPEYRGVYKDMASM